jgi:uncharacterized protein YqgC (DUF456 family)
LGWKTGDHARLSFAFHCAEHNGVRLTGSPHRRQALSFDEGWFPKTALGIPWRTVEKRKRVALRFGGCRFLVVDVASLFEISGRLLGVLQWAVVFLCLFFGLLGTVLPVLPGTALILFGVCFHEWFVAPPQEKLGWGMLLGFASLVAVSYVADFFLVAAGARRFGASKYGPLGAVGGLLVGACFGGLPGILLGPPCGVVMVELLAGKKFFDALVASWGTMVGTVTASVVRAGIGLAMVAWFVIAICH